MDMTLERTVCLNDSLGIYSSTFLYAQTPVKRGGGEGGGVGEEGERRGGREGREMCYLV